MKPGCTRAKKVRVRFVVERKRNVQRLQSHLQHQLREILKLRRWLLALNDLGFLAWIQVDVSGVRFDERLKASRFFDRITICVDRSLLWIGFDRKHAVW